MTATAQETPIHPLKHAPFLLYFGARSCSQFAFQMAAVAVGWQIYAMTDSAFLLGMAGLVQFIPTVLLVFIAGHAADRFDRRRVAQACQFASGVTAAFLAWGSYGGWLTVPEIFTAIAIFGTTGAFESPTVAALLPNVAPKGALQRATAVAGGAFQIAVIGGPALSGLLYAVSPGVPYTVMALFWLIACAVNGLLNIKRSVATAEPRSFASLFAGVGFVRSNPAILGTISLDLFAVLLGGATALMPIYARDILHTGPWGLGLLRGAPAVGALLMTVVLAHVTFEKRVGMKMFVAVIVFGLGTIVFALSEAIWLSVVALAVMGAADTVSVVIRMSLVQLRTPDDMRGRVSAVNFLFINASNQLGEFESGVTAALLGAVPAALIGGVGTVAVALLWMWFFPALRKLERLE